MDACGLENMFDRLGMNGEEELDPFGDLYKDVVFDFGKPQDYQT